MNSFNRPTNTWKPIVILFACVFIWALVAGCKNEDASTSNDNSDNAERNGPALAAVDQNTPLSGEEPVASDGSEAADSETESASQDTQEPDDKPTQPPTSQPTESSTGEPSQTTTSGLTAAEPTPTDEDPLPSIMFESLEISSILVSRGRVTVGGRSTLPDDTCVYTRLSTESEVVSWWPDDECINLSNGRWQIVVQLGEENKPEVLDESEQYNIMAWADTEPVLESAPFYFDLDEPDGENQPVADAPPPTSDDTTSPGQSVPPPIQSTPSPGDETPPSVSGTLRISALEISPELVAIAGRSTLPDGICIFTQLSTGGEVITWWPSDECTDLTNGEWQLIVNLGEEGRPDALDEATEYVFQAWAQVVPIVEAKPFFFDMDGPPGT